VLSVFAGVRPLVRAGDGADTAALSRDHTILVSRSGLITVTGGKWTTYRKMAQDVIDQAELVMCETRRSCKTETLSIHGSPFPEECEGPLRSYGADAMQVADLAGADPALAARIHPDLPVIGAQVVWAVRHEMARTVEDVLARRTRALLLDARASIDAAPKVAALMAAELGRDSAWERSSVEAYRTVARRYVLA
jgi:glycerol-3-phosphate dehydrogenase